MIAIVCSGRMDDGVLKVFARRILPKAEVRTLKLRGPVIGKDGLTRKVKRVVKGISKKRNVDKIVVVEDADRDDPCQKANKARQSLKSILGSRSKPLGEVVIISPMMEAWLLADPQAVEKVLGTTLAKRHKPLLRQNPKRVLADLCSPKRSYTPQVAKEIAEAADINLIVQRCLSFKRFKKFIAS